MLGKEEIKKIIIEQGMLPLYYHPSSEVSIAVLEALYKAGVKAIEYTNRGEHAIANFKAMRKLVTEKMPGMQLGIGTIKTIADAQAFMDAGADFIICPVVNAEIAKLVQSKGFLWIPGCMTPTEIDEAERNGASLVKIFPGNILGPGFVSAIKELFPNLLFMPTGGVEVDKENLQGWFKAGVCAVGMGSKLITKASLENKDYEGIKNNTLKSLALIKEVRG